MSLMAELKRRNVLRVAFAYLAGAWLLIQIVETLFPVFGLSDGAIRAFVIIVAIGFVPVLVLAWVFELTPEGLMRESEIDRDQSISAATGKKFDRVIVAALALALTYFAVDKFVISAQREAQLVESATQVGLEQAREEQGAPDAAALYESIAVLPFLNLSNDKENEYFSDGLTETLLHMLSQLPDLRVSARTSSFVFKGQQVDVRDVALALGVAHILEGSVQKSGSRIRVNATLIRAADGFNLWSNKYDRTLDDIFAIQDEIALRISSNLNSTLSDGNKARLAERYTSSPAAYELYLKGRYLWNQRTNQGYRKAVELFQQAIDLDPNFARAYAGLADAQAFLEVPGVAPARQYEIALGVLRKALEIDDSLGEAHASMGLLLQNKDWDFAGAAKEYQRAIDQMPSYASAYHWYGELLVQLRQFDEAFELYRQAAVLDPLSPAISSDAGLAWYLARDYERAIAELRKSIDADPTFSRTHTYLAGVHAELGQYAESIAALQQGWLLAGESAADVERKITRLRAALESSGPQGFWQQQLELALSSPGPERPVDTAKLYARTGASDEAFALLEKAFADRLFDMLYLNVDPAWDSLRDDPRFDDLLRRIGFP
ncbi:MAG: tetratricopeptide repeat protein [Woeseia sp.]